MSATVDKKRSYSIGIIGKPNVGKSTFFAAATMAPAEIGNYPFTTITPNRGMGYVRTPCVHKEFNVTDAPANSLCIDNIRLIPIELIDCAGLVPGAWQGRGLGNQFLDEVRKADALVHIVDVSGSTDIEGKRCRPGTHDPLEDVQFLEVEITMWIASILKRDWARISRTVETGGTRASLLLQLEERLSGLSIRRESVLQAIRETELNIDRPTSWSEEEFLQFVNHLRKIAKPMLIAANKIDLPTAEANLLRLKEKQYLVVPCSAEAELVLRRAAERKFIHYKPGDASFEVLQSSSLSEAQMRALTTIKERILDVSKATGVQAAINEAYFKLLNCIVIYPVEDIEKLSNHNGQVLPDAYLVPNGTTSKQLAYLIHTELGDNFIYAVDAREKNRLGENYVLRNNDVISIVSAKKRA